MKLVLFTSHYPFGKGEDFVENEVRVAETRFDEITIVSFEKKGTPITKYIPTNARVIQLRNYKSEWLHRFMALRSVFFPRVWKETIRLCREREDSIFKILCSVVLTENAMAYLHKKRSLWKSDFQVPTIYESYWLSASATYLAKYRQEFSGLCVSRAHRVDCFFDKGIIPYRKIQLTGLDGIFPISDAGKEDLLTHYSRQIPNLAEKTYVHRLGIRRSDVQKNWTPGQVYTVMSCSSIIPIKRLDLLINALAICKVPIHWIHYGDGTLRDQIMSMAHDKLDALSHITYEFRGNVPNNEILKFYEKTSVDLFVNCSDSEGIPVSVMEAMAYGIPVIARDVGGNREIVDDTCGLLLPAEVCPADLGRAINEFLARPVEDMRIIRQAAMKKIENNYDAERNYQLFYDQLEELWVQVAKSHNYQQNIGSGEKGI